METPLPLKARRKPGACDVSKCRTRANIQVVKYQGITVKLCHRCRDIWNQKVFELDPEAANSSQTVHEQSEPEQLALAFPSTAKGDIVPIQGSFFIDGEPAEAPDGPIAATMRAATRRDAVTLSYAKVQIVAALEPIREELESSVTKLSNFAIHSQTVLDKACELAVDTKGKIKHIEAMRTKLTRPILDLKREVDSWFEPTKSPALKLEKILKTAISTFRTAEKQRKIAALRAGDHEGALAMDEPTLSAGVQDRTLWRWRVVDKSKIPAEYWALDAAKIQARVTALKAQCDIPGIEVYPESNIASPAE